MADFSFRRGTKFDKTLPLTAAASGYTSYSLTIRTRVPASTVTDDTDAGVVARATSEPSGGLTPSGSSIRAVFAALATKVWPHGRLYAELKGQGFDGDADFVGDVDTFEILVSADYNRGTPETPAP